MDESSRPYSVREYAERLGVSREAIYRWIKAGHLSCLRLPGGDIRIRQRDAAAFEGETGEALTATPNKAVADENGTRWGGRDPVALGREMRRKQKIQKLLRDE